LRELRGRVTSNQQSCEAAISVNYGAAPHTAEAQKLVWSFPLSAIFGRFYLLSHMSD
jgi:hypothetical protein